jgi:hypothetical protein
LRESGRETARERDHTPSDDSHSSSSSP